MTSSFSVSGYSKNQAEWYYKRIGQGNVLDIGCCRGELGCYKPEGVKLYGVDIDGEIIKQAKNYEQVIEANAEQHLPFVSQFFDCILAVAAQAPAVCDNRVSGHPGEPSRGNAREPAPEAGTKRGEA